MEPLEAPCPACKGTSRAGAYDFMNPGSCISCDGKGLVPTESGYAILDLVRRNIGWLIDEIDDERERREKERRQQKMGD